MYYFIVALLMYIICVALLISKPELLDEKLAKEVNTDIADKMIYSFLVSMILIPLSALWIVSLPITILVLYFKTTKITKI